MVDYLQDVINEIGGKRFSPEYFSEFYNWILQLHSLKVKKIPEKKARLVTIDGMGGSGKDSCIEALCSLDPNFEPFREDDVDPFHNYVRRLWDELDETKYNRAISAYLIAAGKKYVNETILAEKLQDNSKVIVTNRSFLSSIAYSFNNPLEDLLKVYSTFPYNPDIRVVLICEPDVARKRKLQSGVIGRSDSELFLKKSYPSFINMKNYFPDIKIIDTSYLSINDTAKEIMELARK